MRSRVQEKHIADIDPGRPVRKIIAGSGVGVSGMESPDTGVRRLLVPIKDAKEINYGVRYASHLMDEGVSVKVCLLHVADTLREKAILHTWMGDVATEEDARLQSLIAEATAYLEKSRIRHSSHIRRGDVVFMIFDSAELLDCHEIVLPESRSTFLSRVFSDSIARKLLCSNRCVPVVMVNEHGQVCASSAGNGSGNTRKDRSGLAAGGSI